MVGVGKIAHSSYLCPRGIPWPNQDLFPAGLCAVRTQAQPLSRKIIRGSPATLNFVLLQLCSDFDSKT